MLEDRFTADAAYSLGVGRSNEIGDAQLISLHRLMLSKGVYDEAYRWPQKPQRALAVGIQYMIVREMISSAELFEFFRANIFPDFYQWELDVRIGLLQLLGFWDQVNVKTVCRFFRPDGRFHSEDLRHRCPSSGLTMLQEFARLYFKQSARYWTLQQRIRGDRPIHKRYLSCDPASAWEQMRLVMRDMASLVDIADLSAPDCKERRTPLVHGFMAMRVVILAEGTTSNNRRQNSLQLWKRPLRAHIRHWLENLLEAGHDLEAYGEAEMAVFHLQD